MICRCSRAALENGSTLNLDFDIDPGGQVQPHEHIDRLRIWIEDIDQAVVRADLEVLVAVLIDKSRAAYGKPFDFRGQRDGPNYMGAASFGRFHDPLCGLIQDTVIVCLEFKCEFFVLP